jgi:hypothetical protein
LVSRSARRVEAAELNTVRTPNTCPSAAASQIETVTKPHDQFAKRWRITSVIGWDEADLDLLGPAFIEFDRNGTGNLQVLAIEAGIDWRMRSETDDEAIEWSWIGDDDGTETSGRGQAQLAEDGLVGTLFIHLGDDLQFRASPGKLRPPKTAKRPAF